MWHISHAPLTLTGDLDRFLAILNAQAAFFPTDAPITVARAPGRLDLMGGIADYSGSLVLQMPLGLATFAAVQADVAPLVTVRSLEPGLAAAEVALPLAALFPSGEPLAYAAAHQLLTSDVNTAWAAYVAGVLVVLGRELGFIPTHGLRILIASDVPAGKGVSSSAAIEVATMMAISRGQGSGVRGQESEGKGHEPETKPHANQNSKLKTQNLKLGHLAPRDLALLCQMVENRVVGAPCGVMDQMASALGQQGALLALLCQPAEVQGTVALPPELAVWGIDSGIRHAVSGADYGSVRVGAFMGRRILQERADVAYLVQLSPSQWEQQFRQHIPVAISGAAFLQQYGETGDTVTRIDPAHTYAVRQPTAHPIYEHHRVQVFRALLEAQDERRKMEDEKSDVAIVRRPSSVVQRFMLLGELMFQSHASYSACGLGSGGTDLLVELVRAERENGLYGAKITGGGSGGTVAVLGRSDAGAAIQRVAERYAEATGHTPLVLAGSSPGAAAWGVAEAAWRG